MTDNSRTGELRFAGHPLYPGPTRALCSACRGPLELEDLAYERVGHGERVYFCPACNQRNVLYSAAWINP